MRNEQAIMGSIQFSPRLRHRRGASLIEMLIVISILGAILTMTGMTLQLLLRSEKIVSQSLVTERTIARLANLFREDVHRAESGVESADAHAFELIPGSGEGVRIRYLFEKGRLTRAIVDQTEIVARDDFNLPDCQIRIVQDQQAGSGFLSLTIERPAVVLKKNSEAPVPLRKLEIQACLDQRKRLLADGLSTKDEAKFARSVTEEQR